MHLTKVPVIQVVHNNTCTNELVRGHDRGRNEESTNLFKPTPHADILSGACPKPHGGGLARAANGPHSRPRQGEPPRLGVISSQGQPRSIHVARPHMCMLLNRHNVATQTRTRNPKQPRRKHEFLFVFESVKLDPGSTTGGGRAPRVRPSAKPTSTKLRPVTGAPPEYRKS